MPLSTPSAPLARLGSPIGSTLATKRHLRGLVRFVRPEDLRPTANPWGFHEPPRVRFPEFRVPRHIREEIGEQIRAIRKDCGLSEARVGPALALQLSPAMIASWEKGAARPWAVYVHRLSKLSNLLLNAEFIEGLRGRFAPWTLPTPGDEPTEFNEMDRVPDVLLIPSTAGSKALVSKVIPFPKAPVRF